MKLEINLNEWARGRGMNYLLRSRDGKRCCLGIYARACEIPDDVILDKDGPYSTRGLAAWPPWLFAVAPSGRSEWREKLIKVNDADDLPDEERRFVLAGMFAQNGVEVTFVEGPEPEPPQ